jgi:hypothetical protein
MGRKLDRRPARSLRPQKIQASIDSCPVSCIHWVEKADLPALEYVMQYKMTVRRVAGLKQAAKRYMRAARRLSCLDHVLLLLL